MLAVTDCRIPEEALNNLKRQGYDNISLPPFHLLPQPVSSHPDMLIFTVGGKLITHSLYYKLAKKEIDYICRACGLELCLSEEEITPRYPQDVLFNAALLGNKLIGNLNALSRLIISSAISLHLKLINTRQGYTKCSICKVSENAIITADDNIARSLESTGVDVLKINPGHVTLSGYNYGFIGGASGTDENNVYFCGNPITHPDGEKIISFCKKHKKRPISLTEEKLCDVGTIMLL